MGIHTYKKDRSTQVIKCSPWGTKVKPFASLQKKMVEYLRCRQITATSFSNRSYQPRPKATAIRRCKLVNLTRPNREKLFQPRKVKIGPLPIATQRNWFSTLKAKDVEAAASSQTPTPIQPAEAPAAQSPTSPLPHDTKYITICTPLEKLFPNVHPISLDLDEDLWKEERKDHDKKKITTLDAQTGMQILKNRKGKRIKKDQKDNDRKRPQTGPKSSSVDTFTPRPSKSSIEQLGSQSSALLEVED